MADKATSIAKRKRICAICGTHFLVKKADRKGVTCSRECSSKHINQRQRGRKASPETREKISAALKAVWGDPERSAKWTAAVAAGARNWHADPDNAAAFAKRSSERMKRRHADPEWQKVRDTRSSRVMTANWVKHREVYVAQAIERYEQSEISGVGINSDDAKAKKAEAAKWIMTKAGAAMRAETDYNAVYTEVQARLRREMPYDGPQNNSDYYDYSKKLGHAVVNSPECRAIADEFMATAIPRFAKKWRGMKENR